MEVAEGHAPASVQAFSTATTAGKLCNSAAAHDRASFSVVTTQRDNNLLENATHSESGSTHIRD